MPIRTDTTAPGTSGVRLLRELIDEGRLIFTTKEAQQTAVRLGIPKGYLSQLLPRLAQAGWLMRLRRGLYAGTGGLPGSAHVHPYAIATRLVTPSAISHWSAMNYHGLTEQIPQEVTAFTPTKVVTPSMRGGEVIRHALGHAWEVEGTRYHYVSARPEAFFGIEEVWIDQAFRVPITDRERTVLEGFAFPRMFGGMGEILGILGEHIDELDQQKLVDYALRYGKGSVSKRLGWALERSGALASLLIPLQKIPVSGYRVLDPTKPRQGGYDRRWSIQDNLGPAATQ